MFVCFFLVDLCVCMCVRAHLFVLALLRGPYTVLDIETALTSNLQSFMQFLALTYKLVWFGGRLSNSQDLLLVLHQELLWDQEPCRMQGIELVGHIQGKNLLYNHSSCLM